MRKNWTNLILTVTAYLYKRKKALVTSHSIASMFNLLIIIIIELLLAIISLPLYLTSKETISGDQRAYKIRRIVSLSSLIIILTVWSFKLIFIVGLPMFFDTKQGFFVSQVDEVEEVAKTEESLADFYRLEKSEVLTPPEITNFFITTNGSLQARGTSEPASKIALLIYRPDFKNEMGVLYLGEANNTGEWQLGINDKWKKAPGQYSAKAMIYDESIGSSNFSPTVAFDIKQSLQSIIISKIDTFLNYFVIIFLVLGILSIILLI